MGLVFNTSKGSSKEYISDSPCRKNISRQRQVKALTRQNIQFLKSLGLKIAARAGNSRV